MNDIEMYTICFVWCQGEYVRNLGYMMFDEIYMMSDEIDMREEWMNDSKINDLCCDWMINDLETRKKNISEV